MMTIHFKAIEDTLLSMEERYDIKLTDGLESFLVLVCNRIFEDQRIRVSDPNSPFAKIPFRKVIFMDACKEVFPVYQDGALERECQRRNIPFLEEVDRTFQKIRERLDREAQEDTEGAEDRIIAEYRMGLTRYQMDVSREELIRRGKWRLMQISLREWDNDDEGIFYCSERMFLKEMVFSDYAEKNDFFYVIEPSRAEWDDDERESHWMYIRAEVYDGFIREIFEPYGKVEFYEEKYVLRITGAQACSAAAADIEKRWSDLVCRKEPNYPDVRAVYYSLMRDCLNTVKGVFYWLNKAEKEVTVEVTVYGACCPWEEMLEDWQFMEEAEADAGSNEEKPHAEGHPYLNRLPRDMDADGQGITYEEYGELISRIEEEYALTLHWGDEEEHMKLLEEEHMLHPMGKSFMETVWCHTIMHTPDEEYQSIYGMLDRRILLDMVRMVYPSYENGRLKETCEEDGIDLPEIFRSQLKVEEPPMSSLYINHEELIQNGRKLLRKEIQDWCSGCPTDPETEFYLANYALLTDAPIEEDFPNDNMNYYVVEPILYLKDDPHRRAGHRLYLVDYTYDALMRGIFEETLGYRMSGDKYHLTITEKEMELLIEKRIKKEIQGAKHFCDDPQCGEEEYAWYETVRCVWMKFIEFVQKVYQDYGAGRPEIVLYGPYDLKKEGIPPTYREFLLDCLI